MKHKITEIYYDDDEGMVLVLENGQERIPVVLDEFGNKLTVLWFKLVDEPAAPPAAEPRGETP